MAQRSVIQIIQQVCGEFNLPQPQAVVSSQNENLLKLLAFLRATCEDLLKEHDWQVLQANYSFPTVDGQADYALPTDIERFISLTMYDSTSRWPIAGSLTPGQWAWIQQGWVASIPYTRYRVWDNRFYLDPTPGPDVHNISFEYISNAYARTSGAGLPISDITTDSDVIVFDHRLVVYGIKVKWLASISQDTTAALVDYARALAFAKGSDTPSQRLSLLGPLNGTRLLSVANVPIGNWTL